MCMEIKRNLVIHRFFGMGHGAGAGTKLLGKAQILGWLGWEFFPSQPNFSGILEFYGKQLKYSQNPVCFSSPTSFISSFPFRFVLEFLTLRGNHGRGNKLSFHKQGNPARGISLHPSPPQQLVTSFPGGFDGIPGSCKAVFPK